MAVGEDQHYGRASRRLGVAQPALSRQIQDLEKEIGFKLFDRMPRGVKLSAAGELFLEDARRILQEVGEATARAARVARGQSGTLRVGFAENASWHGVVPDSFRQLPGAATRCGFATSTGGESGTVGRYTIRPTGCRVRQFHAEGRSGFGPTYCWQAACRAGRAQKTSSYTTQETPPARPDRCTVCLVSKAGQARPFTTD